MRHGPVVLSAACVAIVAACSDSSGVDAGDLQFVSVPAGDTAMASLSTPLTIQTASHPGSRIAVHSDSAALPPNYPQSSLRFRRASDPPGFRLLDTLTTDSEGRASISVSLGPIATTAVITAVLVETGQQAQATIVIRPGNPASLVVTPNDTAVYVNRGYALKATLKDQYGNPIPTTATFATQSSDITVSSAGALTARTTFGRDTITAQASGVTGTAFVSVVPEGRIAAAYQERGFGSSSYVALVNLDGTAYRTFPVPISSEHPQPAWHPSGSYLIAGRIGSAAKLRVSALDTTAGTWREISGLDPSGGEDGYAEFSHDGTWIYVARSTGYISDLHGVTVFRIRADGSGSAQVVGYDSRNANPGFLHPTVSRDNGKVAVTLNDFGSEYRFIVPATPSLGVPPAGDFPTDTLATGIVGQWSPVSDTLIMFGSAGMFLIAANAHTLADKQHLADEYVGYSYNSGGFAGASWSPDGRWIIARAQSTLILIEVATRRVIPLPIAKSLSYPAWRPR